MEILAKCSLTDLLVQTLMRGRDHTEVAQYRLDAAHRQHLAVLQHSQQFDLNGERDVRDLIKEDRAAVARCRSPGWVCSAPVNAPRTCPKSSLSASDGFSEATFTAMNGPADRPLC